MPPSYTLLPKKCQAALFHPLRPAVPFHHRCISTVTRAPSSLHPPVKLCLCMLKCLHSQDTHLGISRVVSTISKSLLCPVKEHSTGAGWNESRRYTESTSPDKVSVSNPGTSFLAFPLLRRQRDARKQGGQESFCCHENNSSNWWK